MRESDSREGCKYSDDTYMIPKTTSEKEKSQPPSTFSNESTTEAVNILFTIWKSSDIVENYFVSWAKPIKVDIAFPYKGQNKLLSKRQLC